MTIRPGARPAGSPGAEPGRGTESTVAEKRNDTGGVAAVSFVYTTSLAIETITMPLLALHAGYSKPAIGVLTAISAVAQLVSRIGVARAVRRIPDRAVIVSACLLMAASAGMLALSATLPVFVVAELVQGSGRGAFWTGSQAHVVRSRRAAVGRLATTTFVSSFGQLLGPLIAGPLLQHSFSVPLACSAGVAAASAALTLAFVHRLDPVAPQPDEVRLPLWGSPSVRLGCWAGMSSGAWRAMLNSYVPVLLKEGGLTSTLIGVVVAAGNAASIAGSGLSGLVGHRHRRALAAVGASTICTGVGIGLIALAGSDEVGAAFFLAVSGLGAGALQTLSPAVAAIAVPRLSRPDAVAIAGSFRSGALFAVPLAVAGALSVVSLTVALEVSGVLMALPATGALRRAVWTRGDGPEAAVP